MVLLQLYGRCCSGCKHKPSDEDKQKLEMEEVTVTFGVAAGVGAGVRVTVMMLWNQVRGMESMMQI